MLNALEIGRIELNIVKIIFLSLGAIILSRFYAMLKLLLIQDTNMIFQYKGLLAVTTNRRI
jgi:hypothetical protein